MSFYAHDKLNLLKIEIDKLENKSKRRTKAEERTLRMMKLIYEILDSMIELPH